MASLLADLPQASEASQISSHRRRGPRSKRKKTYPVLDNPFRNCGTSINRIVGNSVKRLSVRLITSNSRRPPALVIGGLMESMPGQQCKESRDTGVAWIYPCCLALTPLLAKMSADGLVLTRQKRRLWTYHTTTSSFSAWSFLSRPAVKVSVSAI